MSIPGRQQLLSELDRIAGASSFGVLVDSALNLLDRTLETDLVSYNEMDFDQGTARVVLRPFTERQALSVDAVARYLAEHPVFQWYAEHPGWSPVRMSETSSRRWFPRSGPSIGSPRPPSPSPRESCRSF